MVHFVAATRPLATAVSCADRLLASRTVPVRLRAVDDRVEISADDTVGVFGSAPAVVHEFGEVVVGLRALATILAGVTEPDVQLRIEGGRLAVRTPSSRFALPTRDLPTTTLPQVPVVGVATGLATAASVVAGAASRDGLPLFTAVRMTSAGQRLTLVATDRFRAAVATVAWQARSAEPVDVLVPAGVLAAAMRFTGDEVPIRAAEGWFGADWPTGGIVTPALAVPFPDAQLAALMRAEPICTVQVDADALGAAVERVMPFAGDGNGVVLDIADGIVSVRGDGELGEAREDVKASTSGDHVTARYQARYLADAVRSFDGTLRIQVQQGIRPTLFGEGDLRYLIVPLRPRSAG